MSDYRLVQCFGVKKKPKKPDKLCRRRYIWTARDAGQYNFGSRGAHVCPYCGTAPDFRHPFNKYLDGKISEEEAQAKMPEYLKLLESENKS